MEPCIIVIFGITGDLAARYLLPSLYHLFQENLLPEPTKIIGLTRQGLSADELYGKVELCINEKDNVCDPAALKKIREATTLLQFDPEQASDYDSLKAKLAEIEQAEGQAMNHLFYLSIPPKLFMTIITNLGQAGLQQGSQNMASRLLVEKPFGSDLASAQELIDHTASVFQEEQVYRIDHYVAKETVQNILTFRSENPVFASLWDKDHVERIDILAAEKIGIENRVQFYEGVGALRDLIQSHLLQLLAIATMEMPADELSSQTIHAAKQQLLETVKPADPAQAVRAQYETYKQEVEKPESTTETFAQVRLTITNDRWQGVPVTITTGKALPERRTDISVTFAAPEDAETTNVLTFRIQPNEGIHIRLRVKKPSFEHEVEDVVMNFSYQDAFGVDSNHPSAYERVLADAVKGDRTLFASSGEVLASWRIIEPVIQAWANNADGMQSYANGSAGPDNLIQ